MAERLGVHMRLLFQEDCSLHIIMSAAEKEQQKEFLNKLLEDGANETEVIYYILRMIDRKEHLQ